MPSIHPNPKANQALHLADLEVRYANLLAAARATIAAAQDDETDPLCYLRDELADHGQLPTRDQHPSELLAATIHQLEQIHTGGAA